MQIICSFGGIVDYRFPRQGINDIAKAGYENVVFGIPTVFKSQETVKAEKPDCVVYDNETAYGFKKPELDEATFEKMLNLLDGNGIKDRVILIGGIGFNKLKKYRTIKETGNPDELIYGYYKEALQLAAKNNCKTVTLPPEYPLLPNKKTDRKKNERFHLGLGKTAAELGIHVLIGPTCRYFNGNFLRGFLCDAKEAKEYINHLNKELESEVFDFAFDTGVYNLTGQNIKEAITELGSITKAVVIRENDGVHNGYMLPFTAVRDGLSTMDWRGIIRGLRETGFDGKLIMDFGDTAGAFSPILRGELISLSKKIADFITWQIEQENNLKKYPERVLFGAGNMCRNYMKDYGEKYPPLYTCDNNSALWGTDFEGLKVHSPEDLKSLDKNTAIFICNTYYREIEAQLRDMGITNPIEYFNDEYMATMYFDRIEREG